MPTAKRLRRIEEVVRARQAGAIVLEDIQDPHNAAAVLRSCDGFGIQIAHFVFIHEKPFDPRRVGKISSSSANKWLDIHVHETTADCLSALHQDGYQTIATVLDEADELLYDASLVESRIALLFGNERRGLSKEAVDGASRRVSVPMIGMVRSLNLAATASIFLFELTRQRRAKNPEAYSLEPVEAERLINDFRGREDFYRELR